MSNGAAILSGVGACGGCVTGRAAVLRDVSEFGLLAGGDENSPEDTGSYVQNCAFLQNILHCAVLSVAHSGYSNRQRVRGHSSLPFAIDTELTVERDPASGISTATISRQRDGIAGDNLSFSLRQVTIGYDEDDDPVTTCLVEPSYVAGNPFADSSTTRDKKGFPARLRLSDHDKRALQLLDLAIRNNPEFPNNPNVPPNTPCTNLNLWKRYCVDGGLIDSEQPKIISTIFRRSFNRLLVKECIKSWQTFVWSLS